MPFSLLRVVRFAIVLRLSAPLLVAAQNDGDYPSCIGLGLASDFYFEGDVTDSASCQEACSVLFQDDGTYDTVTAADGTVLAYCECSGQGGRVCQDELSSGSDEMTTTTTTTTTTTALPEEGTMVETTDVSSPTPVVVPSGEASTSAPPPSSTATPTSSAAATFGVSVILLSLLAMTAATLT
eukprot:CAMPEP_0202485750 /NCGR_PEP_ID=MMETSP1361-20130828/4507_1 /ASSEMBLY_ACC=CAM_ASM_000849 /TAXON_ID=210615 /ORGANISM="Staurosira complex sp., Strain CCMP2646" /LENGTH=181 /DNA_ID=CAMNT_0049114721 /DNA_START=59 /DNA_END=604 /DNA_ORIENTATION=-